MSDKMPGKTRSGIPGSTKDTAKVGPTRDAKLGGRKPTNAPALPTKKAPKLGPKSSGGATDGSK